MSLSWQKVFFLLAEAVELCGLSLSVLCQTGMCLDCEGHFSMTKMML